MMRMAVTEAAAAADRLTNARVRHAYTRSLPRLHYVEAGPPDGKPVMLLHGFPDFWYGWRHQIEPLATAGYHVFAADQRGYNLSDKPRAVSEFRLDLIAEDALRLADEVAPGRPVTVIGHDFGAAVAWWLALHRSECLDRIAVLNVPHPAVFQRALRRSPAQWLRSWYILFFQLPRLPEWGMRLSAFRSLSQALRQSSLPGAFSDSDLERYREAWAQPGALTAMLHWYRALLRSPASIKRNPRVRVPTLILWGIQDVALGREMAPASLALCDRGRLVELEDATHWAHLEVPALVNDELLAFLAPAA